jgi:CBS domain-containing protein
MLDIRFREFTKDQPVANQTRTGNEERKGRAMATVSQLLAVKGHAVHTISMTSTVFEAIGKMVNLNVGALLVLDGMKPVGMLTERDYLRKIALQGRSSRTTLVREVMSEQLLSVELDTEMEACMSLMTKKRIRHLPVFAGTELAGIVSIGDIVKHLASDRKVQIEQLTAYIQGVNYA